MELFYVLLILLLVTRVFGEIASRLSQPVLVGELLAGVTLGVIMHTVEGSFPVLSQMRDDRVFHAITDLAIFFLMLMAGVEMRPTDISQSKGPAFVVALGGMLLPMAMGLALAYAAIPPSDWKLAQMLYLGVALSVTAVPITIATLMDLGKQRSRVGRIIVSAAVFDDLISLLLLAVLTSVLETNRGVDLRVVAELAGKVLLFFIVTSLCGRYLFPLGGSLTKRLQIKHVEFSMLLGWALAFSVLAEWLGMHFILGAYVAGLFFTRHTIDEVVHEDLFRKVETITLGFFAPIFFASIGLSIRLNAITEIPLFLISLMLAAFLGKLLGAGLAAACCGLSRSESLAVGIGMNARGAVELVIAGIALQAGLFSRPDPTPPVVANLFSAVVIMATFAAVTSPIGLRFVFSRK